MRAIIRTRTYRQGIQRQFRVSVRAIVKGLGKLRADELKSDI